MGAYDDDGQDPRGHMSRRMRHVFNDQGHAVALILCAIVLLFVCLPLFLVDDLFYAHKKVPEATNSVPMRQPTLRPGLGNRSQWFRMRQNYTTSHFSTSPDYNFSEEDLHAKITVIANSPPSVSASDSQAASSALILEDDTESALGGYDDMPALKVAHARQPMGEQTPNISTPSEGDRVSPKQLTSMLK